MTGRHGGGGLVWLSYHFEFRLCLHVCLEGYTFIRFSFGHCLCSCLALSFTSRCKKTANLASLLVFTTNTTTWFSYSPFYKFPTETRLSYKYENQFLHSKESSNIVRNTAKGGAVKAHKTALQAFRQKNKTKHLSLHTIRTI